MNQTIQIKAANGKSHTSPFAQSFTTVRFHRALSDAVRGVGVQLELSHEDSWEARSVNGDHVWSRWDLAATGYIIQCMAEALAREGLDIEFGVDNEEVPLAALRPANGYAVNLVADPIDGSKAFDNFKHGADVGLPRPGSAVSISAVCPVLSECVATALYCFDLQEVYSSVLLGWDQLGAPYYASCRNGSLLRPLGEQTSAAVHMEAKRRVLTCEYNSLALPELARLNLALMERGFRPVFGGLTGSSATDIVNVVRTSFCASIDVRALCPQGGSVLHWYDVAAAIPIALGRGLVVHVTDERGCSLSGGDHPARMRVACVVARPEVIGNVVDAVRELICPGFLRSVPLPTNMD